MRIMTGAEIPKGADAIVMLEQTIEGNQEFSIRKSFNVNEKNLASPLLRPVVNC